MDRAATPLTIADGYRIRLQRWHWMRLQKRGRLHWLQLHLDTGRHQFSPEIFFYALLQAECYQQVVFDHTRISRPGLHGPFRTSSLKVEDYVELPLKRASAEIQQVVRADKWLSPPAEPALCRRVASWLDDLAAASRFAFRLQACRDFNAASQRGADFDHEWAHALIEFHEYLFATPERNSCDLIYLAYE